jgi:ferredoxin
MIKDDERCIRCGLCAVRCPTDAMTMERFTITERLSGRAGGER